MTKYKTPKFIEWIRKNYCHLCGKCDWIDEYGDPRVDPSHLKTRGAGGQDIDNTVPMCRACHMAFEVSHRDDKMKLEGVAKGYYQRYLDETTD